MPNASDRIVILILKQYVEMFYTESVGKFIMNSHTKFHMPASNGSLSNVILEAQTDIARSPCYSITKHNNIISVSYI
jgi:hypothetical protein